MRLDDLPESSQRRDRRGMTTAGGIAAGGGGILLLILGLVFGVDTSKLGIGSGGEWRPAARTTSTRSSRARCVGIAGNGLEGRVREAIERLPATSTRTRSSSCSPTA